jgi:lipopolysaccharide export system permease protein
VKTLHIYLTRQILGSLLMTVLVFTFVLLLGNFLKEILPMLVSGQISVGVLAEAVGLLIPFVWVFALPMGMLTATLLIFGRFSADQEYTATRASGISLLSLVSPILLLSLALCGVSALVNMEVGPRCRVAYRELRLKLLAQLTGEHLPEGRIISDLPGYILYIGKNRQGNLEDIKAFQLGEGTNTEYTIRAPRGKLDVDTSNKRMVLTLFDARLINLGGAETQVATFQELPLSFDFEPKRKSSGKPKISDMSFTQLQAELKDLERRMNLPLSPKELSPEQRAVRKRQLRQFQEEVISPVVFQMHRQVAFSFACFGFTMLGIPLGIRVQRRETNIGIALALLLVAIYYSFVLVGQALDNRPEWLPHLIVWLPNFLFQGFGAFLLWRANRG